jgi:DNA-binding transcriptional MerR regulator
MVVWGEDCEVLSGRGHMSSLTVEPNFKSSCRMDELLSIGEVAIIAGVATSAVRYYERRGLLMPDTRRSGQRRYGVATLRRLIFIGMLQDAGLSLDDIDGLLHAETARQWKMIASERLTELSDEIDRLQRARTYLEGALMCRYDHPLTECKIMGTEIDRRLVAGRPSEPGAP